jgi:hypothetical protein
MDNLAIRLLQDLLRPRAAEAAFVWLNTRLSRLGSEAWRQALLEAYTAAPRRLGRQPANLSPSECDRVAALDPELSLAQWTVADISRALVLLEAQNAGPASDGWILTVYQQGDSSEQQSWLRSLPLLPTPEQFVATAIDSCRTNILPQFESIVCENPYPSRYFPELNFNQMVLKALFNNIAMERIIGLERRQNAELSRMASDYMSERRAAGRSVPPDIFVVIKEPV